jgi:hypothetical protein
MEDKNLMQAIRTVLKNRNIEEIKKVEFYRKGTIDMVSFVDHIGRTINCEITIQHDSRQSRCIK